MLNAKGFGAKPFLTLLLSRLIATKRMRLSQQSLRNKRRCLQAVGLRPPAH
jgi:hypothetical protein